MCIPVLLGLFVSCAAGVSPLPQPGKETKLKPAFVLRGSHSAIRKTHFAVVTAEAGWKELWREHRGKDSDPPFTERDQELAIDFDTHFVVAVITGHDSCLVVEPLARGAEVLIRFSALGYQTEGRPAEKTAQQKAKDEAVADYCFVVLPKPVKTVAIEEDVRRQLDHPPLWKEQRRFPVPAGKK